jgi:spermidine/putrescine transport system permease protein
MKKVLAKAYIWLLLAILYAPIVIIAIFSFTESKVLGNWTGFSLRLYQNVFSGTVGGTLVRAIENTLSIGLLAAALSTMMGSIAAIGIYNMRGPRKKAVTFLNDIPMLNPDIITGISLFILFVAAGMRQGYLTVLLAHVTFCTPYVVLSVMPRLRQMNPNTYEAALDLGATPSQALRKVILPQIRSGMVSGFILAFTLSIDDFAVTLFTKGNQGFENLSTYIYADARKGGLTPELRPVMTIIFLTVLLLLFVINFRSTRTSKQAK